jgi:P-type conjugative transfer protein TrbG
MIKHISLGLMIIFTTSVVAITNKQSLDWQSLNVPPLVENYKLSSQKALHSNDNVANSAINESLKWQNASSPNPILKTDGVVRFPYGQYQPTVVCKPLNLCDIELQAGEEIQGILIGDSVRWNDGDQGIPVVYSGAASKLVPHLVLKPSQAGLDTTLMITTSKRTYMLKLRSSSDGYIVRAGFYYPSEETISYGLTKEQLKLKADNKATTTNPDVEKPLLNMSKLNYKYTMSAGNYNWRPTQIFDDGISVYIRMPDIVGSQSLPTLCVLVDNDNEHCELVNFRYNDHFYIVDKLFNKARLANGAVSSPEGIIISREITDGSNRSFGSNKKRFWSTLFGR